MGNMLIGILVIAGILIQMYFAGKGKNIFGIILGMLISLPLFFCADEIIRNALPFPPPWAFKVWAVLVFIGLLMKLIIAIAEKIQGKNEKKEEISLPDEKKSKDI